MLNVTCHLSRLETLKKIVPHSGKEGIDELMRIAVSLEELIFNSAINQVSVFSPSSFLLVEYFWLIIFISLV